MPPKLAFVSHSTEDRAFVSKLVDTLRGHGIRLWYSASHLRGGNLWQDEIGKALRECDWFLLVLSPSAVNSMWVKRELSYALQEKRLDGRVVPIVCKRCEYDALSWTIRSFQVLDFTSNEHGAFQGLFRIWGVSYVPPPKGRHSQRRQH